MIINKGNNAEETAINLIKVFIANYNETLKTKATFHVALSGGKSPEMFFEKLSETENIIWNKIHFFWVDERCVHPNSEDSNYGNAKKIFLDKINIKQENVHRIKGENEPENEVIRYSNEINSIVGQKNSLPSFDFILLGVGNDGHTASIFKDNINLFESKDICVNTQHPLTGQNRITISGRVINNGAYIGILVNGQDKIDVMKKIINGDKSLPASYIRPLWGKLECFTELNIN